MKQSAANLIQDSLNEVWVSCAYTVLIYSLIAYLLEMKSKQAFVGLQKSEKAFSVWLKIFENFPEGIAIIRGNVPLFTNKSFN
jgi:hypothetical protein